MHITKSKKYLVSLMTQRNTSSKLLQLQRNLELMELTNTFLMSLAFAFLSNVVEVQGKPTTLDGRIPYSNQGGQASDSSLHFLHAL